MLVPIIQRVLNKPSKWHNISSCKWSMTQRLLKSHRSKMYVTYMWSWKQCTLPVITTMALWHLMHLGKHMIYGYMLLVPMIQRMLNKPSKECDISKLNQPKLNNRLSLGRLDHHKSLHYYSGSTVNNIKQQFKTLVSDKLLTLPLVKISDHCSDLFIQLMDVTSFVEIHCFKAVISVHKLFSFTYFDDFTVLVSDWL